MRVRVRDGPHVDAEERDGRDERVLVGRRGDHQLLGLGVEALHVQAPTLSPDALTRVLRGVDDARPRPIRSPGCRRRRR